MYKLFLTVRYLTRRPLSLVSIAVLSFAVTCLVLAPSVMSGFQEEFHKRLRGTLSDLSIWTETPFALPDDPRITQFLEGLPNVSAVAPYLENPALDKHFDKVDYCYLRGIDPVMEQKVSKFRGYFISEKEAYKRVNNYDRAPPTEQELIDLTAAELPDVADPDLIWKRLVEGHPDEPDLPTVIVGIYYLRSWDLYVGDTVKLTTASQEGEVAKDKKFKIVGTFSTGHHDTDRRILLMSLRNLQEFMRVPGRVSGYSLKLKEFDKADVTKKALVEGIHAGATAMPRRLGYYVKTWEERNINLLKAVAMEKLLIRLITGVIVLAASASIFLVLFMMVHSKVREIGILRAVGGTRSGILSLFVTMGILISIVSLLLGLLFGYVLGENINEAADLLETITGWHPFPPDVYYLDEIPVKFDFSDNLVNFAFTIGLGSIFAFIPGLLAALKPPLKAIRYE